MSDSKKEMSEKEGSWIDPGFPPPPSYHTHDEDINIVIHLMKTAINILEIVQRKKYPMMSNKDFESDDQKD